MNTELHTRTHNVESSKHNEHGSMKSYIIGFILSLILTFNPYYMVVNKMVTGKALLITIIVFAILQMFVQLIFFLHLGRGPKPLYNVVFLVGTGATIMIVVIASLFIMDNLYRNMSPGEVTQKLAQKESIAQVSGVKTGACNGILEKHKMTIKDGVISPSNIRADKCDSITFVNEDNVEYDMIFGAYPVPKSFGGEDNIIVEKKDTETFTLNESGFHGFYDKLNPSTAASFSVDQ